MSNVPSVCFVVRYFTVGGLERVVLALANAYVARGVDVRVVVLCDGERNALISELDTRAEVVVLSGPVHRNLRRLAELGRGRVVHIHFGDGDILPLVRYAFRNQKVVVSYHSVYRHIRSWLKNRVDQACNRDTPHFIAVSEAVKVFCTQDVGLDPRKITVIPNGVSIQPAPTRPSAAGPVTAIALASLYPHKNQATLLDGLSRAVQRGVDVRLRVIGDGSSMAGLFQRCIALGLRDRVEWFGAVWKRDLVQPLLASSDVFVSASTFEGLPISVLEGMAHGLPMLLSDIPPHREACDDAGVYFDARDAGRFADELQSLCADASRRARLAAASRERVRRFDLEASVDAHFRVYSQVASA